MAGLRPRFEKGPITFRTTTVANGGNVKGGTFVEFDGTTGRIKAAAADSGGVLGLAIGDAAASDFSNADTTDTWGNTIVNAQIPPNEVSVAWRGVWDVEVVGATLNPGALVAVGANGKAKPWANAAAGAASNAHTIVGRCVSEAPVAVGQKARILLGSVGAA